MHQEKVLMDMAIKDKEALVQEREDELEKLRRDLKANMESERHYKGSPHTNAKGTVFRIPIDAIGFICARVQKGNEPIIVRGGVKQAQVKFDFETGKAEWEPKRKEEIYKHVRDLASAKKSEESKAFILAAEQTCKESLKQATDDLKELRKHRERCLNEDSAQRLQQEVATNKLEKSLDAIQASFGFMKIACMGKKLVKTVSKNIKEALKTVKSATGSASSSTDGNGGTGATTTKPKPGNKFAMKVSASKKKNTVVKKVLKK